MATVYTVTRGEDASFPLENYDEVEVLSVQVGIKKRRNNVMDAEPIGEVLAMLMVEPRAELTPGGKPGWLATLTAAQSLALEPWFYALDARLEIAGDTVITEMVSVKLQRGVMERPA
jgi:hypothetical protein